MDDQLREHWWVRASTIAEYAHVNDGTSQDDTREAILALLATEYDRGKVDGAVEELGLLARETGPGKPGETWEQWAYRVSDYLKDRLAELKAKGESKDVL